MHYQPQKNLLQNRINAIQPWVVGADAVGKLLARFRGTGEQIQRVPAGRNATGGVNLLSHSFEFFFVTANENYARAIVSVGLQESPDSGLNICKLLILQQCVL